MEYFYKYENVFGLVAFFQQKVQTSPLKKKKEIKI